MRSYFPFAPNRRLGRFLRWQTDDICRISWFRWRLYLYSRTYKIGWGITANGPFSILHAFPCLCIRPRSNQPDSEYLVRGPSSAQTDRSSAISIIFAVAKMPAERKARSFSVFGRFSGNSLRHGAIKPSFISEQIEVLWMFEQFRNISRNQNLKVIWSFCEQKNRHSVPVAYLKCPQIICMWCVSSGSQLRSGHRYRRLVAFKHFEQSTHLRANFAIFQEVQNNLMSKIQARE
jgi:hypothetical protein